MINVRILLGTIGRITIALVIRSDPARPLQITVDLL